MDRILTAYGVEVHGGEAETVVNVDGIEAVRIDWNKGRVIRGHLATDKAREPSYIPRPDCGGKSIEGDPGMRKVVNLVTNYMSALCETKRRPGRVDRNIEAGTAVYFPGGGAAEFIESPEDCARVLNEYFL